MRSRIISQRFLVEVINDACTPESESDSDSDGERKWRYFDHITSGVCSAMALRYNEGSSRRIRDKLEQQCGHADVVDTIRLYSRLNEVEHMRRGLARVTASVLDNVWSLESPIEQLKKAATTLSSGWLSCIVITRTCLYRLEISTWFIRGICKQPKRIVHRRR